MKITVARSPSKQYWAVVYNNFAVLSPGHATKAEAEKVAAQLRLKLVECAA